MAVGTTEAIDEAEKILPPTNGTMTAFQMRSMQEVQQKQQQKDAEILREKNAMKLAVQVSALQLLTPTLKTTLSSYLRKAEHDMMKQAVLSSSDPSESAAAADLDRRLKEVYHEVKLNEKLIRKTDDDAWWLGVSRDGKIGNRCYIPGATEWQNPRFVSKPG